MLKLDLERYEGDASRNRPVTIEFICSTESRTGSRCLLSHPRDLVYERTTAIIGMRADHVHRRDVRIVVRFQHPAICIQLEPIMDAHAIVKM